MDIDDYQFGAYETVDYPQDSQKEALTYLDVGLAGEAGEIANKFKKYLRGDFELTQAKKEDFISELGDVLWYVSEFARQLDYDLSEVASRNFAKLASRKKYGTIKGDGEGDRVEQLDLFNVDNRYDICLRCKSEDILGDESPCNRCNENVPGMPKSYFEEV